MFFSLNYKCPENYNPADYYIKNLAIKPDERNKDFTETEVTNCQSFYL
jgi:hypothetical protein